MKKKTDEKSLIILGMIFILIYIIIIGAAVWTSIDKTLASTINEDAVVLESKQSQPKMVEPEVEPTYTEEELFYMAAAIYNEAGSDLCSDDTRRLVGYVILNRVNDSRFPDSIKGVLEQKRQYGRFYWTGIKFADRASLPQEQYAVERAYRIAKECLETQIIPIPSTVLFQAEFEQGIGLYSYQDGIYFCYAQEVK